jgi:hypothetical protein
MRFFALALAALIAAPAQAALLLDHMETVDGTEHTEISLPGFNAPARATYVVTVTLSRPADTLYLIGREEYAFVYDEYVPGYGHWEHSDDYDWEAVWFEAPGLTTGPVAFVGAWYQATYGKGPWSYTTNRQWSWAAPTYLSLYFPTDGPVTYTETISGPTPEPASWAMLAAGFGLAGGALRKRRAIVIS